MLAERTFALGFRQHAAQTVEVSIGERRLCRTRSLVAEPKRFIAFSPKLSERWQLGVQHLAFPVGRFQLRALGRKRQTDVYISPS
mgnify:CR=1 FL=1